MGKVDVFGQNGGAKQQQSLKTLTLVPYLYHQGAHGTWWLTTCPRNSIILVIYGIHNIVRYNYLKQNFDETSSFSLGYTLIKTNPIKEFMWWIRRISTLNRMRWFNFMSLGVFLMGLLFSLLLCYYCYSRSRDKNNCFLIYLQVKVN